MPGDATRPMEKIEGAGLLAGSRYGWRDLGGLEAPLRVLCAAWAGFAAFLAALVALAWATRNQELFEFVFLIETPGASVTLLLLFFATAVLYLIWKYRATCNRWCLSPATATIRPGWAVGWYFVPIANLVMPLKAMLQLSPPFEQRVYWWWGLYLAAFLFSVLSEILLTDTASLRQLRWGLRFMIGEWLCGAACALVLQGLIAEIGRWQRRARQGPEESPAN